MERRHVAGGVAVMALLIAAAWWMGWLGSEAADIAQIQELAQQPESEERNNQMRDVMREKTEGMTDEQKMNFFVPIFVPIAAMQFEKRYDAFMAMTPEQQRIELDKAIDQMEKGRQEGEKRQAQRQAAGGGGGGGRRNLDPKRADEMFKKIVAYVTPQQRSKFDNGIQIFNQRREERGLEPIDMPMGGRR